jgi:hypothetical protein
MRRRFVYNIEKEIILSNKKIKVVTYQTQVINLICRKKVSQDGLLLYKHFQQQHSSKEQLGHSGELLYLQSIG